MSSRVRARALARVRAVSRSPRGLIGGFLAVHGAYALALLPVIVSGGTEGDLPLYRMWAIQALRGHWQVVDEPWVYPAGALAPIVGAIVLGPWLYQLVWLAMTTTANLLVVLVLTGRLRRRTSYPAAWYWLLMVVLLAPVSQLRLEAFAAPPAIAALVVLARRPAVAGALLAAATWIKVWPAAIVAAALVASRQRARVVAGGLALTAVLVGIVAAYGGGRNLLSFLTIQGDRSLQLEAPVATPWVWGAVLGVPGSEIYQNAQLATREVRGAGAPAAAELVGLLLPVVFAAVLLLVWRVRRAMPRAGADAEERLVLLGAFALTAVLIVFNKVGSPQYLLWLAPIVTVGVLVDPVGWRRTAVVTAWTSLLTSLVFPVFYLALIDAQPGAAALLLGRNLLLVWLLADAVGRLWRAGSPATAVQEPSARRAREPSSSL